jgi:hypothetical protein
MPPERVITISLSESDWKALRTIQPEPVDWLKSKIRETIEQARQTSTPAPIGARAATATGTSANAAGAR